MIKLSAIPRHIWFGVFIPLVFLGTGVWRLWPTFMDYLVQDEHAAIGWLQVLALHEIDFAHYDRDGNGFHDFWTGDIAGLLQVGNPIYHNFKIHTDSAPLNSPVPIEGYYLVPLKRDRSVDTPEDYRRTPDTTGRKTLHPSRFGFCAYPAQYDWRHRLTFIINQERFVYAIDNGGKPVTEWPSDEDFLELFEHAPRIARD